MPESSSGVDCAIVVSQRTSRFDGPKPVTYALRPVTFWLARMKNILSGGRLTPLRSTTRSNCWTSAGCACCSGSNLSKSGSIRIGVRYTPKSTAAIVGIQNQNHQRSGDLRMIQKSTITSSAVTSQEIAKLFVQSRAQLPQPCTDSPYASDS